MAIEKNLRSVAAVAAEIQDDLLKFIEGLIGEFDSQYRERSLEMLRDFQDEGFVSLKVDDEIWHQVQSKLEKAGVPFMCMDNQKTDNHVFIAPATFTQMLESTALVCARDADRLTEISKDEINDLCFEGKASKRYELSVENNVIANRLREALTKNNQNKCPFSMTRNDDKTVTFACTYEDIAKMNRAYFETMWHFAGQYAELNRQQEEYDLKRQEALEKRIEEPGHYYIVDPVLDSKGVPTGEIKEMVEVTDDAVMYYKNGKDISSTIVKSKEETSVDHLYSLVDRQSRPIVIEENEMSHLKDVLCQKNPKVMLQEKDLDEYKADKKVMLEVEMAAQRCLNDPINQNSIDAIHDLLHKVDVKRELAVGNNYSPIAEEMKDMINRANPTVAEITSYDLSSLDRVLALENQKLRETREKEREHKLQAQITRQRGNREPLNEDLSFSKEEK